MNDATLIVLVLVAAIGGLAGVAYLLDRRRSRAEPPASELPAPGPIARVLLWVVRLLVAVMVVSVIGFFVLRSLTPIWFAAGALIAYAIVGRLYQVARLTGR